MGSSSSSSICGKSKKQILQDGFNCFNLPQSFLNTPNHTQQFENGKVVTVNGNSHIKGKLYQSKRITNPTASDKQIQTFYLRHSSAQLNTWPIIKIHGVKQIEINDMCSKWNEHYVIAENHIPLEQFTRSLSFQQCLYVLFDSLMGFFYLYLKHLNFEITDKMILMNKQGKIKVWINQNLAENSPQNDLPYLDLVTNIQPEDKQKQQDKKREYQWKIIKQVFDILDKKFQDSISFQSILFQKLKPYLENFTQRKLGFKDILQILCKYQQNTQNLFIPNRLSYEEKLQSLLPERQSFYDRLKKAVAEYNVQQESQKTQEESRLRKQQQFLKKESIILPRFSDESIFSTGKTGNTLNKYKPNYSQSFDINQQAPRVHFNVNSSHLYNDFGRDRVYSDVESEIVTYARNRQQTDDSRFEEDYQKGSRGPQLGLITNIRTNELKTYIPSEYQQELRSISKDLRQTNYKSTGDDNHFYIPPSQFNPSIYSSTGSLSMDRQLNRSNSDLQWIKNHRQKYGLNIQQHVIKNQSTKHSTEHENGINGYSQYKRKLNAAYFMSSNNQMRIAEQEEAKQSSNRQSLANRQSLTNRQFISNRTSLVGQNKNSNNSGKRQLGKCEEPLSFNNTSGSNKKGLKLQKIYEQQKQSSNFYIPTIQSRFFYNQDSSSNLMPKNFSQKLFGVNQQPLNNKKQQNIVDPGINQSHDMLNDKQNIPDTQNSMVLNSLLVKN